MFDGHGILISRIDSKHALGPNESVTAYIGGAKAARERSEALLRKAHHNRCHFLHVLESLVPTVRGCSKDLGWFSAKQIPGCVNSIDSYVIERTAPLRSEFRHAHVVVGHLLGEFRSEHSQVSQLPAPRQANCFEVPCFKVKTIRDHQFRMISVRGVDHSLAVLCRNRHRFFTEDMNASRGGVHILCEKPMAV